MHDIEVAHQSAYPDVGSVHVQPFALSESPVVVFTGDAPPSVVLGFNQWWECHEVSPWPPHNMGFHAATCSAVSARSRETQMCHVER